MESYFVNISPEHIPYAMSFCYTVTTQKSVDDAITNLTNNLKEIGWSSGSSGF